MREARGEISDSGDGFEWLPAGPRLLERDGSAWAIQEPQKALPAVVETKISVKIAIIAFDGFTDVETFLPFDFFHRVTVPYGADYKGKWRVRLVADRPRILSYSGIAVEAHGRLDEANTADGVFVVSGDGSRAKMADPAFISAIRLDPSRQIIGAIDS